MKQETLAQAELCYDPCRYGTSRLLFRGPRRSLDGRYIAFVGGTETYGKFVEHPFPELVERRLGLPCVNFGCVSGGIDVYGNDPTVLAACEGSALTVVQIMGAQNLSNRFYTVHPRRNDRFVEASTMLRNLYPTVDFSEFCFTRHMLSALRAKCPQRFEVLRVELQLAWSARMQSFLKATGPGTLLLWFAEHLPSDDRWEARAEKQGGDPLRTVPLFVTRTMVDALRPLVRGVVLVQPSARARAQGTQGMIFAPTEADAAAELPGVMAHAEVADALTDAIRPEMG